MQISILSKKYSPRRESIDMTTSLDHQPLCCQNTFYKQFTSVYKLIIHNLKISRNTQALGHSPVHHSSPMEKGLQTKPIETLINTSPHYSESRDPIVHITQIVCHTDKLLCCFLAQLYFSLFIIHNASMFHVRVQLEPN